MMFCDYWEIDQTSLKFIRKVRAAETKKASTQLPKKMLLFIVDDLL